MGTNKKGQACDKSKENSGCEQGHRCAYSKENPQESQLCVASEVCGQKTGIAGRNVLVECSSYRVVASLTAALVVSMAM